MFDEPGIDVHDVAWIQRDQFVYYVEMARGLGDIDDWDSLRGDLAAALAAAFGTNAPASDPTAAAGTESRAVATTLLDYVRSHHDPGTEWPRFMDALWERRRCFRDDL